MLTVFAVSFFSVLRICLICLAGTWLARKGIISLEFRRGLSKLILMLMLPCLLVEKLSAGVNSADILHLLTIPLTALIYIGLGFCVGMLVLAIWRPPRDFRRVLIAANSFGNSGYIPYPLVMAIAATAPLFAGDPGAADRGVAYVSIYLVGMSPCLWGIGFPFLSHRSVRELKWHQVLSPPVLSALAGIAIGAIPPLRGLLVASDGALRVLMDTAALIGQGAIPCALLILGGNLADIRTEGEGLPGSALLGVCWGRLICMPLLGALIVLTLHHFRLIPDDPMCALVLLLESAVPPATNLIVMCQVHKRGEKAMSQTLLTTYLVAVFTLTVYVAFCLKLIGTF
jgi:predicted permease